MQKRVHSSGIPERSQLAEVGGHVVGEGRHTKRVRQLLLSGRKTAGAWLGLGSEATAEVLARAGFDWLLVDLEHGLGDHATLVSQLRAISGLGPAPLVRAPWNDLVWLKRILDAGAEGVVVPYVNDRSEAVEAVAACLYPPRGQRGVARSTRAAGQGRRHCHFEQADDEILIIAQVETLEAVQHVDDILSVPRLDGIFIGPVDLSASMGHLGDRHHPSGRSSGHRGR
jgi:2-keto-3-deoxy-L-rhamnonate aldolase RhmA